MSKNKIFSETSANRYSLALYELAKESNELEEVEKNCSSLIKLILNSEEFKNLKKNWENRVNFNSESETSLRIMKEVNPLVIPRNHIVENAIKEAEANNNLEKFKNLMRVLENPYINNDEDESYQSTSENSKKYITYCGT